MVSYMYVYCYHVIITFCYKVSKIQEIICLYIFVYVTLFKCYLQKINSKFDIPIIFFFFLNGNNTSYYKAWTKINLAITFNKLFL